ncbi:nucleoside hydrolase [Glaciihabitans arcticus]|uniref:Nucleoside hydrolase n=1 Tax=Glaciihabitans arcticus TaxID=2668039 RepID=A0A4Q9GMM0_9MICO|nr:nucleoside hydrolase [Glaciihabitans arcticus]TBN55911.1 nucleoside hydrolase [Glaciihabitans arcticus]
MTTRIPMIIDTDTAQDDCVALLVGLLDPLADLRAITMVAGNVGFERQVLNAWMTLSVAGRLGEVPVYLGCRRPMVREWVSAENVHGDGAGGLSMDFEGLEPEPQHGVDALIELAAASPGEVSIVCIGPLTNIAMAAVKDPAFVSNVKSLFIMGGSNNARGNITAAAEYNFYVDPEAAKTVFEAGFDITVVPWAPLTLRDAVFSREKIAEIGALGTPLGSFFKRVVSTTLDFDESVGIPGSTHPDSLTAAVLLHPELVTAEANFAVDIETGSELTRGYSAMSWGVHGLAENARVIEAVDAAGFAGYLTDLFSKQTTPSRKLA